MSIILDLPEELASDLASEAARLGLSLPEYVLRLLSTAYVMKSAPKTGAELVEYWQAEELIDTRPDIADSRTHARQIRNRAERRKTVEEDEAA